MFYRIHFNENEFESDHFLIFLMLAILTGALVSFIIIYCSILT